MFTIIVHIFIGAVTWCAMFTYPVFPCAGVIGKVGALSNLLNIPEAGVTKAVLLVTWCVGPSYSGWCVLVIITILYGEKKI